MGSHIVNGKFQSDKYPSCPPGKVPLSVEDPMAQDLLWQYAMRRIEVDEGFSRDLCQALQAAGYDEKKQLMSVDDSRDLRAQPAIWVREGARLQIIGYDSGLDVEARQDGPWALQILVTRRTAAPQVE